MEQKHYLDAAAAFANAAEYAPSDPRPLFNLGLTWDRAGWTNDALRFYKQALQRDPRYLPALRGAIRAERLLQLAEPDTLERLKLALGQETDEKWRTYFMFQRGSVEQELYKGLATKPAPAADDGVPPGGMYLVPDVIRTPPPPPPTPQ
jgi:tetratricopeptide (TPR) repeat protein